MGADVAKLSISQAWEETKGVLARDGKLLGSVALALIVLPQTVGGLFAPRNPAEAPGYVWAILLVATIIGFAAQVALNRLAIGPSTSVGAAVGRGFARVPVLLGTMLMVIVALFLLLLLIAIVLSAFGLIVAPSSGNEPPLGVMLLLVLVTLLTFAIIQLAVPVAAIEDGGSLHLIARSWALGRGHYWRLLAFVTAVLLCLVVVLLTGQIVFGSAIAALFGPPTAGSLGALLSSLVLALIQASFSVVSAVMLARIYVQLANGRGIQASVPSSGT